MVQPRSAASSAQERSASAEIVSSGFTPSDRGTIEPSRWVVVFWGVVMGAIAAIMLIAGAGGDDALSGIQKITIIMAAPFALVMVVLCVALAKDLYQDPMMRRDRRSTRAIEQAVEFGTSTYGDEFVVSVKRHPDGDTSTSVGPGPASAEPPSSAVPAPARD